jgi:hypothetical protein
MSSISVAGDVSGAISIAAPSAAGSGVLTLPTGTDTLVGKATTDTLTNKTLGAGTIFPAGAVLQVVQGTTSAAVSNSTTTYADTGLTATITPKFATSKILVFVSQLTNKSNGATENAVNIKLFRAAVNVGQFIYAQGYTGAATTAYGQIAFQYLDSPATTSATAYKTQFSNNSATAAVSVQPGSVAASVIILMEIAG